MRAQMAALAVCRQLSCIVMVVVPSTRSNNVLRPTRPLALLLHNLGHLMCRPCRWTSPQCRKLLP